MDVGARGLLGRVEVDRHCSARAAETHDPPQNQAPRRLRPAGRVAMSMAETGVCSFGQAHPHPRRRYRVYPERQKIQTVVSALARIESENASGRDADLGDSDDEDTPVEPEVLGPHVGPGVVQSAERSGARQDGANVSALASVTMVACEGEIAEMACSTVFEALDVIHLVRSGTVDFVD